MCTGYSRSDTLALGLHPAVAENHQRTGGLATLAVEALYEAHLLRPLTRVGLEDDRYFDFGAQAWLEDRLGTIENHVLDAIRNH
jgi:transketolase